MTYKKKLIEVALPLEVINRESAREKSIKQGHPSTLHLWWARRPLAACRAVLFASLVDDPSSRPDRFPTESAQDRERQRLFRLIEELVRWEQVRNRALMTAAHTEIMESADGTIPVVLDPFSGGGSIPLEALRLGLKVQASDLNPVAVLITRALVGISQRFADSKGVRPIQDRGTDLGFETGVRALADDLRYYGRIVNEVAWQQVGHLYPGVAVAGQPTQSTVMAWMWARTVKCPNPACGADMPLAQSFMLCTKARRPTWIQPIPDPEGRRVKFEIGSGQGVVPASPKTGRGASFRCLVCGHVVPDGYILREGAGKRLGAQLMAMATEGERQRTYVAPTQEHSDVAASARPAWLPSGELPDDARNVWCKPYGLDHWEDLFTPRQAATMAAFSDAIRAVRSRVIEDARKAGLSGDSTRLREEGTGAEAYADTIVTYLALVLGRLANRSSSLCFWDPGGEKIQQVFARQSLPMVWDFVEANPFSGSSGNFMGQLEYLVRVVESLPEGNPGAVRQAPADRSYGQDKVCIATDPPYYDNISYADLSDFFYVWLRPVMADIFPDDFSTLATPKQEELVATPYRFGGSREKAHAHFETGLREVFARMREAQDPAYPMTLFYAFKQTDAAAGDAPASSGWETMLEALLGAGFSVNGTWPIRTELTGNLKKNVGALASSIVLVCRPRPGNAPLATRKEFLTGLKKELPGSLHHLQQGNIAPVDLAQAAIGPGMGIFSSFSKVVEADGSPMTVRTALGLINQMLDETLAEQESDFDSDTRWCLAWFEQYGMNPGAFGVAETLSKAKNTAVQALVDTNVLESRAGKVRLLDRAEFGQPWDPIGSAKLTVWEVTQRLVGALEDEGEEAAAELLRSVGQLGETARELAYRLYNTCERRKWAKEAIPYNMLVVAWPEIARLAATTPAAGQQRLEL